MTLTIRWNKNAIMEFRNAIAYIEQDSVLGAEKFKKLVLDTVDDLLILPERYPPDKYKRDNNGSYRAFEKMNYRISYRFKANQIRVIRLRHTKMSPLYY